MLPDSLSKTPNKRRRPAPRLGPDPASMSVEVGKPRRSRPPKLGHIDYNLMIIVLVLTVGGLMMLHSASAHMAQTHFGDGFHYVKRQAIGAVLGFVGMVLAIKLDIYKLPSLIKAMLVLTILLLIATHIPGIGVTANGASCWINIMGFSFQPSEIAKPILVIYLATVLGHPRAQALNLLQKSLVLVPVGAVLGITLVQPDLGTAIVLAGTVMIVYFAAGLSWGKVTAILASGFAAVLALSWSTSYQQARITSWLDPWSDPLGKGFQMIQSMIAIGSGGIKGTGFGQSVQKLFYLPEQHTDFIFSIMAEEFGFIGVCILLILFGALIQRGMTIACKCPTPYLKLLAIGLSGTVTMQAFINLAVVSGTIPATGLTLPFISFGSSSLIVSLVSMGLLLNVSRHMVHVKPSEASE